MSDQLRPGGAIARRPLHFFWLADTSGSMEGSKIHSLNFAIRESIPALQEVARENPHAELLVRCISFGDEVRWHIPSPTPIDQMVWPELTAGGYTPMGGALSLLAQAMNTPPMEHRALRPAVVLISDGQPTDDFETGLRQLLATPWGSKAVRLSIGVGTDPDLGVLGRFIGNSEIKPLEATNPEQLARFLQWASVEASKVASVVEGGGVQNLAHGPQDTFIPRAAVDLPPADLTW